MLQVLRARGLCVRRAEWPHHAADSDGVPDARDDGVAARGGIDDAAAHRVRRRVGLRVLHRDHRLADHAAAGSIPNTIKGELEHTERWVWWWGGGGSDPCAALERLECERGGCRFEVVKEPTVESAALSLSEQHTSTVTQ